MERNEPRVGQPVVLEDIWGSLGMRSPAVGAMKACQPILVASLRNRAGEDHRGCTWEEESCVSRAVIH
jgi:hypothetical protein